MKSKCDRCGEIVDDIDVGFSPGLHAMSHGCGGTWRVIINADVDADADADAEIAKKWERADRRAWEIWMADSAEKGN